MKKIIAVFITSAILLSGMAGCSEKRQIEKTGATLDLNLDDSYVCEPIVYGDPENILTPEFCSDEGVMLSTQDSSGNTLYVRWNPDTGEFTELQYNDSAFAEKNSVMSSVFAMPDGKTGVLYSSYTLNTSSWTTEDVQCYMEVYDRELRLTEGFDVPAPAENSSYRSIFTDSNGRLVYTYMDDSSNYHLAVRDMDKNKPSEFSIDPFFDIGLVQGASGELYAYYASAYDNSPRLVRLDTEKITTEEIILDDTEMHSSGRFIKGYGEYELCIDGYTDIEGVKISGNTGDTERLLNYVNSDFPDGQAVSAMALPDGRFILEDYGEADMLYLARQRTQEEKDSFRIVTLAGVDFPQKLMRDIAGFNRSSSDVRIVSVDYKQYSGEDDNWFQGGIERFKQDLLSGIVPDIICTDNLPYEMLSSKGLFEDLRPFMKKDGRFKESDYLMNYFDSLMYRGKQERIGFFYTVKCFAGKTKYVGEQQRRSPSEFMEMLDSRPEGMGFYADNFQGGLVYLIANFMQKSFVDTEAMTCTFDSPEFMDILELLRSVPREYISDTDISALLKEDAVLLDQLWINSPYDYHEYHSQNLNNEDMTLVGYPATEEGNGGMFRSDYTLCMYSQSDKQEMIWDLFMSQLSADYQDSLCKNEKYRDRFPVLRSALEDDLEAAVLGKTVASDSFGYISKPKEEEMDVLRDYIPNITMYEYYDSTISNIISEEADIYIANEQTAETTAAHIQERVSLYLSEQN